MTRIRQLGQLIGEFAEPAIAFLAGLTLGILGLTGVVTGDGLTAATLLVLSVVGVSLVRERSLRVKANENVEKLGSKLDASRAAINAIQSGNPYTVRLHETTWDIQESDGSLVYAERLKKIRFDQNNVAALYDVAEGEGTREIEYSPGKAVCEFLAEGRRVSLIALGRVHYRGDEIDFRAKRTTRNAFMEPHESVNVLTRDATEILRLTIKWPSDRSPMAVRLGRATASREWRNEDVLNQLKVEDGRSVYTIEIHYPERGSSTTIEWEW